MHRPTPVTALLLEGFTSRLSFGVLSFALPLYARHLGMSIAAIGLLSAIAGVVSLALKPFTGALADRWGVRRMLLWALTTRSLLCLGYVVATTPVQLFGLRGVHGAADSLRDPAVNSMLAEYGGKDSMASTFAWYQTMKTTAGSFGASLGGLLIATTLGFPLAFTAAFALSFLPVFALAAARPSVQADTPREVPPDPAPVATEAVPEKAQRPPGIAAYAGLGFLVAGSASMLTTLFPIIAVEYAGLSTAQAGLVYLVTPVLALTGPLWGRLSDRVSRPLVLSVRGFANVFSSLVYLLAPNLAGVWTGKALDDMGKAAFRPAWGSMMADVANRDPKTRARAMGFLTAGEDGGTLAAPLLASLLWTLWGVPVLLFARVTVVAISELYAIVLQRRQRRGFHPRSGLGGDRERRGRTEPGRCDACGGDGSAPALRAGEPGAPAIRSLG
jgi:MFS family permease